MTKKLNPGRPASEGNGQDATEPDRKNSRPRAEAIQQACRDIATKQAEVKALQADIGSIKQAVVKGELGYTITDFNFALRLYKLEDERRKKLLATVQETFGALGVGEQLDFITAAETMKPNEAAPGFTAAEGRQAFADGKNLSDNPHKQQSPAWHAWKLGFNEQKAADIGSPT